MDSIITVYPSFFLNKFYPFKGYLPGETETLIMDKLLLHNHDIRNRIPLY